MNSMHNEGISAIAETFIRTLTLSVPIPQSGQTHSLLMGKKLLKLFTKKNCKKQIKKSLELKK